MKKLITTLFVVLFTTSIIHSQELTIVNNGEAGTSGTGWSISGGVVTVTGTASVDASVIETALASGNVLIKGGATAVKVLINEAITSTTAGSSLTIGEVGNGSALEVNQSVSLKGNFSMYGGTVYITNNITISQSGASIKLQANALVSTSSNVNLTTSGGDIIFWSNYLGRTSGEANFEVWINENSSLNSNGGNIILAGGSTADANGYPAGYAYRGSNTNTSYEGSAVRTDFGSGNVSIVSGGGDIIIRGQCGATGTTIRGYGVSLSKTKIDSGAGKIYIEGKTNYDHAVDLLYGNFAITSASTATDAITIKGSAQNNYAGIIANYEPNSGNSLIQASAGGGILLDASNNGSGSALIFGYHDAASDLQILSASGTIELRSNSSLELRNQNLYLGMRKNGTAIRGVSPSVTASSSNIILKTNALVYASTNGITFGTTGNLTIEPYGADFTAATTLQNITFASNPASLIVGKTTGADGTSDSDITIDSATNTAGSISIYGANININQNLNTTLGSSAGDILLKASGNINQAASKTITTSGGDVTFWADSNGNNTGYIRIHQCRFLKQI